MRIHIIAMGGAVMHNLSIALQLEGHQISGSDDEIYNPAKDKLDKYGLLPIFGWYPEKLDKSIDLVIVGMHAKKDNPELARANQLELKVMSYPQYIAEHAKNKKRIVIAGSHGKTTTTSMIMHILKQNKIDFDYLVGAPLDGFDLMIGLSNAPIMVMEGDEYLSAPMDPSPKIMHYQPHISVITGIAWDHINVFKTEEIYQGIFQKFIDSLKNKGKLFYSDQDLALNNLISSSPNQVIEKIAYSAYPSKLENDRLVLSHKGTEYPIQIFGNHNLQNIQAAVLVCRELGLEESDILLALASFKGASKRLQLLQEGESIKIYLDFAHAPSKVKATVASVKNRYPDYTLISLLELHTFSSLNTAFLPQYKNSLDLSDEAIVFYNKHTFEIKGLPALEKERVRNSFDREDLKIFTENFELENYLASINRNKVIVLFMTSGTFNGFDLKHWISSFENH